MQIVDVVISPKILKQYCRRRQEDVETLQQAVDCQNFVVLERISYQVTQNATNFGFLELSQIAEGLKRAVENRDLQSIQSELTNLQRHLQSIVIN